MTSWVDTFRSLFLGSWWWFPSAFFAPWWFSLLLMFLAAVFLSFSILTGGSNAALFFGLAVAGVWAGCWARRLHGWECTVLVPQLPRHLFVLPVAIVVAATLSSGAFSIYAGNPLPAVGPALLVGIGIVYALVRVPEWLAPLFIVGAPWLVLVWLSSGAVHLQVLSHPLVQIAAVVPAVILLTVLKRSLASSVFEAPSSAVRDRTPAPVSWNTSATVKRLSRLALKGFVLDMLIGFSSSYPYLSFMEQFDRFGSDYEGLFFTAGMIILCPLTLNAGDFPAAWLMGQGGSRSRLARTLVGRMVYAGALPLLGFFLAVEMVQSLMGNGSPRFETLLQAQVLAFTALAMAYAFRRRYPNGVLTHVHLVLVIALWFFGGRLLHWVELGVPMWVLLVVGSAVAAIYLVGHGLARADYRL